MGGGFNRLKKLNHEILHARPKMIEESGSNTTRKSQS